MFTYQRAMLKPQTAFVSKQLAFVAPLQSAKFRVAPLLFKLLPRDCVKAEADEALLFELERRKQFR